MITIHDDSRSVHISARLARELTHEELIAVFQQNRDRRAHLETVTMRLPMNKYEREADRLLRLDELETEIEERESYRDSCIETKNRGELAETLQTLEKLRAEYAALIAPKPPQIPVLHVRKP